MFARLWASYCRVLAQKPLQTKCATGVVGSILGDTMAQVTAYRAAKSEAGTSAKQPVFRYDFVRCARLCAYAAFIGTPIGHFWFAWLDANVMPHRPSSPFRALTMMLLDQTFMAPFGTALFFWGMKVLEGKPAQAAREVREKLWPALMASYCVWPLANLCNFYFVPTEQRILFVNVIYVFWVAFMSHMASKKPLHKHPPTTVAEAEKQSHVTRVIRNGEGWETQKEQ